MSVQIHLKNPLRVPLVLTDVTLLWKFLCLSYDEDTNVEHPEMIPNHVNSAKVGDLSSFRSLACIAERKY